MREMLAVTVTEINHVKSLICQSWGIITKCETFSASTPEWKKQREE